MATLDIGQIKVSITQKNIKNVHLSVHPPNGRVTISAPNTMTLDTIRVYALSKLGWIKKQQKKIANQKREPAREYINRETHYFKGERFLLKVIEGNSKQRVEQKHKELVMHVRENSSIAKRGQILDDWYREQLKFEVPNMLSVWERKMDLQVNEFGIKKMKTRWGSCNINKARIWLNLELAKKPTECLEYVLVHEMVHFLEKTHNKHFVSLMNQYYPNWKRSKEILNRLPVSHGDWYY